MAYVLDPDRPLPEALKSAARAQIDEAMNALDRCADTPQEAVHDLRKAMKKLRALLRLLRSGLKPGWRSQSLRLRDTARRFADLRDAQVLVQTLDRLATAHVAHRAQPHIERVRDWAEARRAGLMAGFDSAGRAAAAREDLMKACAQVGEWTFRDPALDVLREGLARQYAQARERRDAALRHPDPERLHAWRRAVKYHWYHCRLLGAGSPQVLARRCDELDELGECLGDEHDLAVLAGTLSQAAAELPEKTIHRVARLAAKHGAALRARAFAIAAPLLSESERKLAKRLVRGWSGAEAGHGERDSGLTGGAPGVSTAPRPDGAPAREV